MANINLTDLMLESCSCENDLFFQSYSSICLNRGSSPFFSKNSEKKSDFLLFFCKPGVFTHDRTMEIGKNGKQ
jgi:hypothetical protein